MNDGSKKEKEEKMKDKGPNHVLEEKKDKKERNWTVTRRRKI